MRPTTFEDLIRDLRNGYGLTQYRGKQDERSEVVEYLYDKVGNLPEEFATWAKDAFFSRYKDFPKVLHIAIQQLYQDWLQAHPEKRASYGQESAITNCRVPACEDGLLFVSKKNEQFGYNASFVFRCMCGRSPLNGIPQARYQDLMSDGYRSIKLETYQPVKPKHPVKERNVIDFTAALEELEQVKRYKQDLGICDEQCPF